MYFMTFIEDCTKYCYVYLLRNKDETLDKFKELKLDVENQLRTTIKIDLEAIKDVSIMIHLMHSKKNIELIHQTIAPYSLESNEVVDRKKIKL